MNYTIKNTIKNEGKIMFWKKKKEIIKPMSADNMLLHLNNLLKLCDNEKEQVRTFAQKHYSHMHAAYITIFLVGPSPTHTGLK